jgi:hypothetical protein
VWYGSKGFAGLQIIFQRKAEPFDMYEGTLFGQPWCLQLEPDVSVTLEEDEFIMMTLCRLDDFDGITELRLRTSHGRNISCGTSDSTKFAFACHTLANCEVRGLRSAMESNSSGLYHRLEMHEIRRTVTFDVADFDTQFEAILLHCLSPVASSIPAPPSFVDDESDDIDFEDEMFWIHETVYQCGIPSIEDVESCSWELRASLHEVRRNEDECQMIVEHVVEVHDKILALHNRQIAYAGLLVLRLLELLKLTVSAIEKSSTIFSWSGRGKRTELFRDIQLRGSHLMQDLERFTSIEARFASHALAEGKSGNVEGVICDAARMGDLQTACALYFNSVKTAPMETARDTLLISAIREDNLEIFVEILRASPGGNSSDHFQINEDGRTLSLVGMDHVHIGFGCDACNECPIRGYRFRSIRSDNFDLCEACCPLSAPSHHGPFALCVEGGGMRFLVNDSLLSVAVGAGAFQIIKWLVCHFGSDPFAHIMYGCNALDLCDRMDWLGEELREKIHLLMAQYKRRRDFLSCTSTLMKYSQASYEDVAKLVPCITSVYDLRTVFTFGNAHLQSADLKSLLVQAFDQILTEKLVLDDEASLFFDLVLNECKERELLTQIEFIRWSRENVRVNMENAPWVKAIKESIRSLTEQVEYVDRQLESVKRNVGELKRALVAKDEAETRRKNCKLIVSLLSMGLCLVAGPVFEQCFHALIDYAVPAKLLMAVVDMDEEHVAKFLTEKAVDYVFKAGVEAVLRKAEVDSVGFVDALREAAKLEQGDGDESTPSADPAPHSIAPAGDTPVIAASAADEDKEKHRAVNSAKGASKSRRQPASKKLSLFELSNALTKARSSSNAVDNLPANDSKTSTSISPPPKGEPTKERPSPKGKALAPATSSPPPGKGLVATVSSPSKMKSLAGTTSPVVGFLSLEEGELDGHEYHHAVFHSEGDVGLFVDLVGFIENPDSVNDEMEAAVILKGEPQRVSLQPQVLASYMGYVAVAGYFFDHVPQLKPKERKILTLTRAKRAARQGKARGTANCAA